VSAPWWWLGAAIATTSTSGWVITASGATCSASGQPASAAADALPPL